mgnify:CR=1 FL=1
MSKNTGGPAFPVDTSVNELGEATIHQTGNWTGQFPGMTLRDYFAAKIASAQSVCTSADTNYMLPDFVDINGDGTTAAEKIAKLSYLVADAMLKERAK